MATIGRTGRGRLFFVAAALAAALLPASPASSTTSHCFFNGSSLSVYVNEIDQAGRLYVDTGDAVKYAAGGVIHDCGATLSQITAGIYVTGSTLDDVFTLDQDGPGGPYPASIPIEVNLGDGGDLFEIRGTPGRDRVYFFHAVNAAVEEVVDRDGDLNFDIVLWQVERARAEGRGGRDVLGATTGTSGWAGDGEIKPARIPLRLVGGSANDRLFGGTRRDRLAGGAGRDTEVGAAGVDRLLGGAGDDDLDGGKDRDTCRGGPGTDTATRCEKTAGVP